ncbi:Uncharacterised protein [uncultured archaeon]|nr:Uncharacterised protein [uncultured archaeon]
MAETKAKSIEEIEGTVTLDDAEGMRMVLALSKRYNVATSVDERICYGSCVSASLVRVDDYYGLVYRNRQMLEQWSNPEKLAKVKEELASSVNMSGTENASKFFLSVEPLVLLSFDYRHPTIEVSAVTPFHHLCYVLSNADKVMEEQKVAVVAVEKAANLESVLGPIIRKRA